MQCLRIPLLVSEAGQAASQVCPATPIKRSTTACENPDQEFIQFYTGTKTKLPTVSGVLRASARAGAVGGGGGRSTPRQEASGPVDLCVVNHGPPTSPSPLPSPSLPLPLPPSIFIQYPRFDALHIHNHTQTQTQTHIQRERDLFPPSFLQHHPRLVCPFTHSSRDAPEPVPSPYSPMTT